MSAEREHSVGSRRRKGWAQERMGAPESLKDGECSRSFICQDGGKRKQGRMTCPELGGQDGFNLRESKCEVQKYV